MSDHRQQLIELMDEAESRGDMETAKAALIKLESMQSQPSFIDKVYRQLELTARASVEGVAGAADIFTEPLRYGLNKIPGVDIPQSTLGATRELIPNLAQPETPTERVVGRATETLAGGGGLI